MKSAAANLVVTRNTTVKSLLEGLPITGRGVLEGARKSLFHKLGLKFFKELAISLHMQPTEYVVKDFDGPAEVSGEIWLHTNSLFLQMGQQWPEGPVLIRRCFGMKDCAPQRRKHWMPFSAIESVTTARDWIVDFKFRAMSFTEEEEKLNG